VKQGEKARELQKKDIRPVKTTDLQIGKKYISVLDDGTGEFTLKSMISDDYQPPMTDPNVRIMGETYRITAKEWFIEVNAKPYMNTKSRRMQSRRRSNLSRKA
jgi:hypothetical protein